MLFTVVGPSGVIWTVMTAGSRCLRFPWQSIRVVEPSAWTKRAGYFIFAQGTLSMRMTDSFDLNPTPVTCNTSRPPSVRTTLQAVMEPGSPVDVLCETHVNSTLKPNAFGNAVDRLP